MVEGQQLLRADEARCWQGKRSDPKSAGHLAADRDGLKFAEVAVCLRGATRSSQACDCDVPGLDTSCTSRFLSCSGPQAAPGLRMPGYLQSMREVQLTCSCCFVNLSRSYSASL